MKDNETRHAIKDYLWRFAGGESFSIMIYLFCRLLTRYVGSSKLLNSIAYAAVVYGCWVLVQNIRRFIQWCRFHAKNPEIPFLTFRYQQTRDELAPKRWI